MEVTQQIQNEIEELTKAINSKFSEVMDKKEECDVLECQLEEAGSSSEHFGVECELGYANEDLEALKKELGSPLEYLDSTFDCRGEDYLITHLEQHMEICDEGMSIIYDLCWEFMGAADYIPYTDPEEKQSRTIKTAQDMTCAITNTKNDEKTKGAVK